MFNKKEYHKQWYQNNKEYCKQLYVKNRKKILKRHKKYRNENKVKLNLYYKLYNQKNKTKRNAYSKIYCQKNRKQILIRFKKWYQKNRKQRIEYTKNWCQKNPEKRKIYMNQYHKENRFLFKLYNQNRRSLMKKAGPLTIETIQRVYENNIKKYGTLTCYLCLEPIKFGNDHLEHKTPLSKGGTNEYKNLAPACPHCNWSKYNKTEKEYRKEILV